MRSKFKGLPFLISIKYMKTTTVLTTGFIFVIILSSSILSISVLLLCRYCFLVVHGFVIF